jgi:uncharacterized protein (DUF697 family)
LIKLIPGVGSIIGGTINAATDSVLTTAFGEAYIGGLYLLFKDNPDRSPSPQEIFAVFKEQLTLQKGVLQRLGSGSKPKES